MPKICLSCIHEQGICKTLLYRKWYAYMRDACDLYSTLTQQIGIDPQSNEEKNDEVS